MKTCWGVDATFHAFLASLSGYDRLTLHPCNYPLRKEGTNERASKPVWTSLNKKKSLLLPESNTGSPAIHAPFLSVEEN